MKSIANHRKLYRLAFLACTLLALSAGSYSRLNALENDLAAIQRLDQLMISTEESICFSASGIHDIYGENEELIRPEKSYIISDELSAPVAKNIFLVENSGQRKTGDHFLQRNRALIQVGYYQQIRPTVWSKIMNFFNKSPEKQVRRCKVVSMAYVM